MGSLYCIYIYSTFLDEPLRFAKDPKWNWQYGLESNHQSKKINGVRFVYIELTFWHSALTEFEKKKVEQKIFRFRIVVSDEYANFFV